MKLLRSTSGGPGWDEAVIAMDGTVFHSSAWAEYVSATEPRAVPQFFRLEGSNGEALGCALAFEARSPRPVLAALTRRCWLDSSPLLTGAGADALEPFLQLLEAEMRGSGAVVLDLGSYYAAADWGAALASRGFETRERTEFVIPLDGGADDVWKRMDDMRRRNIRRGGRSGVVVDELPADTGPLILRRLQEASIERILRRGGAVKPYDGDPAADPIRILLAAGAGRIVGARIGPDWVSATLLTTFNGRVFYALAGHSARGLETQAGSVLIWECLKWHAARGDCEFNLGGCPAGATNPSSVEHGVYRYKAAFGGDELRRVSGTKALHPARLRLNRAMHAVVGQRCA